MSQKTNSMIKLALVFFISLLSFSIGTYVGKKYSDNQHKLALLEPNKGNHDNSTSEFATHNDTETTKPAPETQNLTDSEVAKIAEEFANEQPNSDVNEAATDEKSIATTEADVKDIKTVKPTTAAAMPKKSAAVIAAQPLVTKTMKPMPVKSLTQAAADQVAKMQQADRVPSSLQTMKDSNAMHFTVQIGSFPTEPEAQKMTKELLTKGYKTTYTAAQVNGQTWFRVNVGIFGSVKEAQDYKKDFLEKTKMTSAIVQKVQN